MLRKRLERSLYKKRQSGQSFKMKITKSQLRKIIKEAIREESNPRLGELNKVTYVEAVHPQGMGLYKIELFYKDGKEEVLRSIEKFNELFGTNLKPRAGVMSFKYGLEKVAPHVEVEIDEMDVS